MTKIPWFISAVYASNLFGFKILTLNSGFKFGVTKQRLIFPSRTLKGKTNPVKKVPRIHCESSNIFYFSFKSRNKTVCVLPIYLEYKV